MSAEVVHDDPYAAYLAGLSELDKKWFPRRFERTFWLSAMFASFVGGFMAPDSAWGYLLIFMAVVMMLLRICLLELTRRRYVQFGRKYLPTMMPAAYQDYAEIIEFDSKTRVKIKLPDGFTFYCGLRKLAESKGKEGWVVEVPAVLQGGSYSDVRQWADHMRIAFRHRLLQ